MVFTAITKLHTKQHIGNTVGVAGSLVPCSGSGTNADPYKGYYWGWFENFNVGAVSFELPLDAGWMKIKSIHVYLEAAAGGITVNPTIAIAETDGAATSFNTGLGGTQITAFANDCLEWTPDMTIGIGHSPYAERRGWSYMRYPRIGLYVQGYGATDDISIHIELEWSEDDLQ